MTRKQELPRKQGLRPVRTPGSQSREEKHADDILREYIYIILSFSPTQKRLSGIYRRPQLPTYCISHGLPYDAARKKKCEFVPLNLTKTNKTDSKSETKPTQKTKPQNKINPNQTKIKPTAPSHTHLLELALSLLLLFTLDLPLRLELSHRVAFTAVTVTVAAAEGSKVTVTIPRTARATRYFSAMKQHWKGK